MKRNFSVLIIGNGRIACAVSHYLLKSQLVSNVAFYEKGIDIKKSNLLIGCLPGDLASLPLKLALRCKKNLIDISDVEQEFYLGKQQAIKRCGITVIPCCGFCPGLLNFILGNELSVKKNIDSIEVSAGSLSKIAHYYPFLWCFEDLILEHRIKSWQIIAGLTREFKPFDGYQRHTFYDIEAESYYAQSGFENMLKGIRVKEFIYRVVRPYGFKEFFLYLENEGFLKKDNLAVTKKIAEQNVKDNISLAQIKIISGRVCANWQLKSFSGMKESLNSMQKITTVTPVAVAEALLDGSIQDKGVLLMEDLGAERVLFDRVLAANRKENILIQRKT
jgi:saccharopine dehydrogenase-like NADP-dependent oxidoreductase